MVNKRILKNYSLEKLQLSLRRLERAIVISPSEFVVILAHCNHSSLRKQILDQLLESTNLGFQTIPLSEVIFNHKAVNLSELSDRHKAVIMLTGLETVTYEQNKDDIYDSSTNLLINLNQQREQLRRTYSCPVILWVNDRSLQKLIQFAPDFYSWSAPAIEFRLDSTELTEFIANTIQPVFEIITDPKINRVHQDRLIAETISFSDRLELELANYELIHRRQTISSDLQADLDFVLGCHDYLWNQVETAKYYFQHSLVVGQQQNNYLKQGIVQFYLGQCYLQLTPQPQSGLQAKNYLETCLDLFKKSDRPDLVAKFVNSLAEVLLQLRQWDQLTDLVFLALHLHQTFQNEINLAQDYGFLAQIAIEQQDWIGVKNYAGSALQYIVAAIENSDESLQSWLQSYWGQYLFWLGRAEYYLGEITVAESHLQEALSKLGDRYEPQTFIGILEILRAIYFSQGSYLRAFQTKQQQRAIEQQFGLCAFIGAGRLQAKRQPMNPTTNIASKSIPALEIVASGRTLDVENLIERIGSHSHNLTIIHGESGVGKSSIVNAGLVPVLLNEQINGRSVLSLILRVYTDWLGVIWQQLLGNSASITLSLETEYLELITEQLQQHSDHQGITVLIFDQFEEFFFTCIDRQERQQFFRFLHLCWQIPWVKVILSMREDYLHLLLELESALMHTNEDSHYHQRDDLLEVSDILSRKFRYPLQNLSVQNARSVIESLTQQAQFYVESNLIDALVEDLATDLGYVRPIELQVVGAQLQSENITSLEKYRAVGSKQKLVERSLAQVIQDCGPDAEIVARQVLLSLTDEHGTRPLKTDGELAAELSASNINTDPLNLVLKILVGSGLVFLIPDVPSNRYQLVHDYLVNLIRQQEQTGLLAELAKMRATAARNQVLINRLTKGALVGTVIALIGMAGLAWQAKEQKRLAETREVRALAASSAALLSSDKQLEALIAAVRAGKSLQQIEGKFSPNDVVRSQTFQALQEAVYNIQEQNRLRLPNQRVPIYAAKFSPDGQMIAAASWNGSVELWSRTGNFISSLEIPNRIVRDVSFSPDGKFLVSAVEDGTLRIWHLESKTQIQTINAHNGIVNAVSFSPDGQIIASVGSDLTVKLWDCANLAAGRVVLIKTLQGHTGSIFDITFSSNGKILASASADQTIKLWNRQGQLQQTLIGHTQSINRIRFSPDGRLLASSSTDKTLKIWQINAAPNPAILIGSLDFPDTEVQAFGFTPAGNSIAVASRDRPIRILDLEGNTLRIFNGHEGVVFDLNFSPDGSSLISASKDGSIRIWHSSETLIRTLRSHRDAVWAVAFSPDGSLLASASVDSTVKLWHKTGELIKTFAGQPNNTVYSVVFSPSGQQIASTGQDNIIKIWDLTGKILKSLAVPKTNGSDRINNLSFSPNGKMIAAASSDKTVKLWRWQEDGGVIQTLSGHQDIVSAVSFIANGQMLASVSEDKTLKLWNLDGQLLRDIPAHSQGILAISYSAAIAGNPIIATASKDKTIKIWSEAGVLLQTISETDWVYGLSFSPDGRTLAAASVDRTVKLWHWQDGTLLKTLSGHDAEVNSVSFSPKELVLASASRDGTLKLWNAETLSLENLIDRGCNWLRDYLQSSTELNSEDRQICRFKE